MTRCKHCGSRKSVEPTISGPQCLGCRTLGEVFRAARQLQEEIEGERLTLELKQKSTRPLDRGKRAIEESPLFGGAAQGSLF